MKGLFILFLVIVFVGCKKQPETIRLRFLDEYIVPDSLIIDNTLVGGLSGIDYQNGIYYIVCDDSKNPRFYEASIKIEKDKITNVDFQKVISLQDTANYYDLESILLEEDQVLLTSEGLIREKKDPTFISTDLSGEVLSRFELPEYYKASSPQKPRTNGVFEGLTRSFDKKGYWIITELPLESDGIAPTSKEANSPVRMTYFNRETHKPERQVVYKLDKIAKTPLGSFAINGVTDFLAYAPNKFLVIERSYSSGHGTKSNDIKIYSIDISEATNVLAESSLKAFEYHPVTKELIFDFELVRDQLTNTIIDNVEGITFGPLFQNGNPSLILIVDNDFNKQGNRLNQFILMEINSLK